jgi:hypothetical protein
MIAGITSSIKIPLAIDSTYYSASGSKKAIHMNHL